MGSHIQKKEKDKYRIFYLVVINQLLSGGMSRCEKDVISVR